MSYIRIMLVSGAVLAAGALLAAQGTSSSAALRNPAALKEPAPATFTANFDTSAGSFVITVHREWAPNGADRFYNLVKHGFYDDVRFHRAVKGFMVQFGLSGNPTLSALWRNARIPADKVTQSNKRGFVTFAMGAAPDTRTTQVFINYGNNSRLDAMGFAPIGEVTSGMEVVDAIHTGYGDGPPRGSGPDSARIQAEGTAYLMKQYAKLDYVKSAKIGS